MEEYRREEHEERHDVPPQGGFPPRRGSSRDRERGGDDRAAPSVDDSNIMSLLVRNISYRIYAEELHRVFSYYGRVKDVYIPKVSDACS